MDAALLDTDILSEVLKQRNATVLRKSADYLRDHGQFQELLSLTGHPEEVECVAFSPDGHWLGGGIEIPG